MRAIKQLLKLERTVNKEMEKLRKRLAEKRHELDRIFYDHIYGED